MSPKNKRELVERFAGGDEEKLLLASLLDRFDAASSRGIPAYTKFLTEEQQALCRRLLDYIKAEYYVFGGRTEAERTVICFLPEYMDESSLGDSDGPIAVIKASSRSGAELTHRDFLGSLMAVGIVRETVGDILTDGNTGYIFVLRELVPFIIQNMERAGRETLELEEIPLDSLPEFEQNFEDKTATVSSMRLDAVVSAAFNISRDSSAQYVCSGRVSLNHAECLKVEKQVKDEDVISVRGLGKVRITATGGISRKGRLVIAIKRYK